MTTITLLLRLDAVERSLLARAVAALEVLVHPDGPGPAPAGPLLLVPRGAPLEFSMASEIPVGMDGIQAFRPANYDGPISATVGSGPATIAPEGDSGDVFRITLADDAADGATVVVNYRADERHGAGEKWTEDDVTYTVVAADAAPLAEDGFVVVEKGQPAPVAGG